MRDHSSHHSGNEKEMIIIHPYSISSFILAYNDIRKSFVDCNVMIPTLVFPRLEFRIVGDLVMKCRPKYLLAISVIVTLQIGIRDEYRNRLFLGGEIFGYI
jgi:hypothetical protein